jgi:hypothetical protein
MHKVQLVPVVLLAVLLFALAVATTLAKFITKALAQEDTNGM